MLLNKEVSFFGEPTKMWKVPLFYVLLLIVVVVAIVLIIAMLVASAMTWIVSPKFRKWVRDNNTDFGTAPDQ